MTADFPKIENAPGIAWRKRANGQWCAWWIARPDIVEAGFPIRTHRLWMGEEPTAAEVAAIQERCQSLQTEMLMFGKELPQLGVAFRGTLGALIDAYQTDPDSDWRKLRHASRKTYKTLMGLIRKSRWKDPEGNVRVVGEEMLEDLRARTFLRWHEMWKEGGKVTKAHSMMTMLRLLFSFGGKFLDDKEAAECQRLSGMLHTMKFAAGKPRGSILTAEQATMIRAAAHKAGLPHLALAQAIQFDCTLRQKDVIGEWVPLSEPGISDVTCEGEKWFRGIRWEEITRTGTRLVLKHVTSKRQKEVEVDLMLAPMVVEELARTYPNGTPAKGPVIIDDRSGFPFAAGWFRVTWRKLARECGIPDTVRNMDSRAGAITEGLIATGGDLDSVRIMATHSNAQTTQGYSRANAERTAAVMEKRSQHRNKSGAKEP